MFPQFPVRNVGANRVALQGAFRPNGAAGIVAGSYKGLYDANSKVGYKVVRTSAGLYTVTFAQAYKSLEKFTAWARVADATATIVQGGDVNATALTAQIRVLQGGAASGGVTKMVPYDLLNARIVGKTKVVNLDVGSLTLGSTPPTIDSKAGGMAFDADAERAYGHWRVPDDWDGISDLTMTVVWHVQNGAAMGAGETAIIKSDVSCVAAGEDMDAGAAQALSVTKTAPGGGVAEDIEVRSDLTIDFDHATSPVAKGDTIWFALHRDKTTDTYAGDVVVTRVELRYTSFASIPIAVDGDGTQPYLRRINGATNAGFQLVWPAGCVDPVQLPPLIVPPDHDGAQNEAIKLLGLMSAANDTPTMGIGTYDGVGTVISDTSAAFSDAFAEKSATIAAGDVGTHPGVRNVILTPGAHATDDLYLMGVSWEYTSTETGSTFALADLAADVDNEIFFEAIFRTGQAP